jgi:hypothetical protein
MAPARGHFSLAMGECTMRTSSAKHKIGRKAPARSRVPRESVRRDYGQEGTESNVKRNTTGQGRRKDRD